MRKKNSCTMQRLCAYKMEMHRMCSQGIEAERMCRRLMCESKECDPSDE